MTAHLQDRLQDAITGATDNFHRLVLVVGPSGSGKTQALAALAIANKWPRINVNLALAERLLDLTKKQRAVRAAVLVDEIVHATSSPVVLLDNVEMLFDVDLAQDPLRLLQGLSRHRTVVAAWPGEFDGTTLTYAEPAHPESRRYAHPDAVLVPVGRQSPSPVPVAGETA